MNGGLAGERRARYEAQKKATQTPEESIAQELADGLVEVILPEDKLKSP